MFFSPKRFPAACEVGGSHLQAPSRPCAVFFVQKPSAGIYHSFFPETISGTQGRLIHISLGTLDQISDAFDAVVLKPDLPTRKLCSFLESSTFVS